jgi:hypothetical protein
LLATGKWIPDDALYKFSEEQIDPEGALRKFSVAEIVAKARLLRAGITELYKSYPEQERSKIPAWVKNFPILP